MVEYYHYAKNEWKMICNAGIHEKKWWQWKKIKLWRKIVQDDIPSFSTLRPHYFEGCSVTRTLISEQHGDYMKNCNNLRTRSRLQDRSQMRSIMWQEDMTWCDPQHWRMRLEEDIYKKFMIIQPSFWKKVRTGGECWFDLKYWTLLSTMLLQPKCRNSWAEDDED